MEHALHIACKHLVETIAPTSPTTIRKKVRAALQAASVNGDLDLDALDDELKLATLGLENYGDNSDDEDVEFSHGDVLGKALALVKQVRITPQISHVQTNANLILDDGSSYIKIRMSPQAKMFFRSSCSQVNVKPLELLLWVRTRWASLYKFLDRVLSLRKVLPSF